MPSTPFVDLATLDLERPLAGPDELKANLAQRGTFEMLNGVLYRDEEEGLIVGFKDIRADDWWASDHIPGRPLFPGVLMIEAAAQLCSYDYKMRGVCDGSSFVGFGGVNQTRFRATVEPDGRLYFLGKVNRIRKSMFTYGAQGIYNDKLVFETEVIGVLL